MEDKRTGEYLEKIGWGKYSRKVFTQCGMVRSIQAWFSDMFWSTGIGYILQGAKDEFNLSSQEAGELGTFFPFGLMIGAFGWGLIGDKYGRMYAFKNTVLVVTISSLVLLFSFDYPIICLSLFFLGTGMGGELSLGGTVFCEYCPPSKMFYLTIMALFWGAGGTTVALSAFVTALTNETSIKDWRYIVASGCIIQVILLFFRYFMKETPAFHMNKAEYNKAQEIFNTISMQNTGKVFYIDEHAERIRSPSESTLDDTTFTPTSSELIFKLFKGNMLKVSLVFGVVITT